MIEGIAAAPEVIGAETAAESAMSGAVGGIQALTGAQIAGLFVGGVLVVGGLAWVGRKLSSNSSLSLAA